MYFESIGDLIFMAGHGKYVWTCYGVFIVLLGLNLVSAKRQRNKALQHVKALTRRQS